MCLWIVQGTLCQTRRFSQGKEVIDQLRERGREVFQVVCEGKLNSSHLLIRMILSPEQSSFVK